MGRPDITTVSSTTLFMRGQVDRVETAPGSMGLHIPSRQALYGWKDPPAIYPDQPFSTWFNTPISGIELPNRDLVFTTGSSLVMLHMPGWHLGKEPLRSVSVEVVLSSAHASMVVAILFSVHGGVRQGISGTYIGRPGELKESSKRRWLHLMRAGELKTSGFEPRQLPFSLEFRDVAKAYALPDGSAVLFSPDKVVFFTA